MGYEKNLKWHPIELNYLKGYSQEELNFEAMAEKINFMRKSKSYGGSYVVRTPRAVAFQLNKIGLLSDEELQRWDLERSNRNIKNRHSNLKEIREIVLKRDSNCCIFCKSNENLQFAHIIPFRKSAINKEREAITLCKEHHFRFDRRQDTQITSAIFEAMKTYYQDYEKEYFLDKTICKEHGFHLNIKKK